jgi:hypothetical protein
MNVYEIYLAGREKTVSVDGDRVEVTKDFIKVFKGSHEVAFFNGGRVDGCTVIHGSTPAAEVTKPGTGKPSVAGP